MRQGLANVKPQSCGRCAMAVDIVSIQRKKSVHRGVNVGYKAVLDALAHHRALLAGNGKHVVFFQGRNGPAKCHIKVLQSPVGMAALQVAQAADGVRRQGIAKASHDGSPV